MFDALKVKNDCVAWIRKFFEENGPGCNAVLGISGGKDSSVAAALCVEALGKDRVIGVLMPNGDQADIDMSHLLCRHLGIRNFTVNIRDAVEGLKNAVPFELSTQSVTNLPPRIRMAVVYAVSQSNNGRVVNTCNLSEDWVGYATRYGDAAGDFSPLSHLTVQEVKAIGRVLGLPDVLVDKVPIDGLCGKTDEDNLGFLYSELDRYIRTGVIDDPAKKARIDRLHKMNLFKLKLMPYFDPGLTEHVKIMSSNVWADVFGNPVKSRDTNLATLIERYMPDAVCFQEMHPHWHDCELQKRVFAKGYVESKPALRGNPLNYTPIYYRGDKFKEIRKGFKKFSGPNDYDSKSASWTVLESLETGKRFAVIATHFYYEANDLGNKARINNAKEILKLAEKIRNGGDLPIFCGGDLNCDLLSEPYKVLEDGGFVCSSLIARDRENFICTCHSNPVYDKKTETFSSEPSTRENKYSIDHILTSGLADVVKYTVICDDEAFRVSDHNPVLVEAEM